MRELSVECVVSEPSSPAALQPLYFGLSQRLALFALLFLAEWTPVTYLVHRGTGAGELLQFAVVFSSLLLALGYVNAKARFRRISLELERTPIAWGFLVAHGCAFAGFICLALIPLSRNESGILAPFISVMWFAVGGLAITLSGLALVPLRLAVRLVQNTGYAWAYAFAGGAAAWRLSRVFPLWNGSLLKPASELTFSLVGALLHLFLPVVVTDRANMIIGSENFKVAISPWCAGLEGTALMLVFSIAWLWFVRRELRFPRALLLIPAGMAAIWISNALRITILILIGAAGAPAVALGGFHSQAGWIAFNAIAVCLSVAATRLPWLANHSVSHDGRVSKANPVAPYLMPFLMILGAAMISRAFSGGVEWLYPLRFLAAAAAIWVFRHKLSGMEWKFGWAAPLTGASVFVMWIALDRISGAHGNNAIGAALASVPAAGRIAWLAARTLGAVVTVPIAEELAFRGFLMRRLISSDFESVSSQRFSLFAFLVSSAAFGVMHGDRWMAGTLAGMMYACVLLWRGRIGDAVIAHATTNALLAAWVLLSGNWTLW